jgi:thioester reductase-like protein
MNQTILLTGGSGVVGQALLEKLNRNKTTTVICLVNQRALSGPNVITITGDITQPYFGLSAERFHSLTQRVDGIIHSAAITDFTRPLPELMQSNVEGVRNVLAFAAAATAPLIHVSTAFVYARGGYQLNNYELSKVEAERVVQASGIPTVIVRPSIVIGDSQTGAIGKFQGIHRIVRMFIKEQLPVVPGSPASFIDYVPQDSVAEAILALLAHGVTQGEYWLTAGAQAIPFDDFLDTVTAHATYLLGHTIAKPRVMKPSAFDRLVRPVFLPAFPARLQRMFEEALDFVKYMDMAEPFPSSFAQLTDELGIAPLPAPKQTLARSVEYIIAQNKGMQRTATNHLSKEGVYA